MTIGLPSALLALSILCACPSSSSSDSGKLGTVTTTVTDTDTGAGTDTGTATSADIDGDGWTVAAGDCDDGDLAVNPGATEVCDGIDNNCDGVVDEESAVDASTWYADADTDSYGDLSATILACQQPDGYVADATDCDDGNVAVNPGALDLCGDGIDNDCAGGDAACPLTVSLSGADANYRGDAAGDHAGMSLSAAGDVNGDGFDDMIIGASGTDGPGTNAGTGYLVLGGTTPSSMDLLDADALYAGEESEDRAGKSVSGAGDVNGDGFDDMIIGAYCNSDGGNCAGAAYLLLGGPAPADVALASAAAKYTGEVAGDWAGISVSGAGDVNGDGFDDLIIGAFCDSTGGDCAGAAYLVLGSASPGDLALGSADAKYTGYDERDLAGISVSGVGDVDGDGLGDVLIGADDADLPGNHNAANGIAFLVLGSETPSGVDLASADVRYVGEDYLDKLGASVSGAGDVDGDGYDDMLMGAYNHSEDEDSVGAAYLMLGHALLYNKDLRDADARYTGESLGDSAGYSTGSAGDVNADGFADILIGAYYSDDGGSFAGAAYLVFGDSDPSDMELSEADFKYIGVAEDDRAGSSVAGAGDVNGDGLGDILIGAPYNDDVSSAAGVGYLLLDIGI